MGKQIGAFNDIRMMCMLLAGFAQQKDRGPLSNTAYLFIDKWHRKKEIQKKRLVMKLSRIDWQIPLKSKMPKHELALI